MPVLNVQGSNKRNFIAAANMDIFQKFHIRFLAGFLNKMGPQLPIELWSQLNSYVDFFLMNFRPTNIKNWHLRPALRVAFVSDFKVSLAAARRTFKTGIPLVCRF